MIYTWMFTVLASLMIAIKASGVSQQMSFKTCGTEMCPNDYILEGISAISLRICAASCLLRFSCLGFCYNHEETSCKLFSSFQRSAAAASFNMYCGRDLDGYTRFGRRAYRFFPPHVALSAAIAGCAEDGAVLAIPLNAAENSWIASLASEGVWIHGSDTAVEGTWVSTDTRIPLPYFNWSDPEPNGGRRENCIHMDAERFWVDVPCSDDRTFSYVCEKNLFI